MARRRLEELAAEKQRGAQLQRALEEAEAAAKEHAAHLEAEAAHLREQLLRGAGDAEMQARCARLCGC